MLRTSMIVAPILLALCLWVCTGCSHDSSAFPQPSLAYRTYENHAKDFSIRFPKSWALPADTQGMTVLAVSPSESPSDRYLENIGVIAAQMDEPRSLEDYHLRNVGALAQTFAGYGFQVRGTGDTTIDGKDVELLDFSYAVSNQGVTTTYYCQEYEIVVGDRAYVVACIALDNTFPQFENLFAEMAHSLNISYTCSATMTRNATPSTPALSPVAPGLAACARAAVVAGQ